MRSALSVKFLELYQELKNFYLDNFLLVLEETSFSYSPRQMQEAILYSLEAGGKRTRPVLALEAGRVHNLDEKKSLAIAVAIEMVHTYSLIHDDLPAMDDDDLRRGKPSSHKKFGEDVAILAGDAMQALAVEICAINKISCEAIAYLAKSMGIAGMVGGQYLDVMSSTENNILYLKKMHAMKTGALFQTCTVMPVLESGNIKNLIEIEKWTLDLGTLFQIADDILDREGDSKQMGKSVGKDEQLNKLTYVEVFGLDGAKEKLESMRNQLREQAIILFPNSITYQQFPDFVSARDR